MATDGSLLLLNGTSQPEIDIIAIHGLNGNQLDTWTYLTSTGGSKGSVPSVCWLRDYLPKDIPGARVHSFGYNANIFHSKSKATLRDLAGQLLNAIDLDIEWQEVCKLSHCVITP